MKGPSKGHFTLLATLLAVSLSSAVPVLDKAPTRYDYFIPYSIFSFSTKGEFAEGVADFGISFKNTTQFSENVIN